MINELDKPLLQGDSNGANYIANAVAKWAFGCMNQRSMKTAGIKTRFDDVMADESAQLAAVFHPKFKLDWVDDPSRNFDWLQR